jgi:hypothetical protein
VAHFPGDVDERGMMTKIDREMMREGGRGEEDG